MRFRLVTFRQKGIDLCPEGATGFLLVVGELGQHGRVAQSDQVGVGFPVLERLGDALSRLGRGAFQDLRPCSQVGLEPVDRLLRPAGLFFIVQRGVILALTMSVVVAGMIVDDCLGREDQDSDIFGFDSFNR
jgi:hypothetical protein